MRYSARGNFTERSGRILDLASSAAREFHHGGITPVHIALGLLRDGEGVAVTALRFHGIAPGALARELEASLADAERSREMPRDLPLTPESEELISQAAVEARELGHSYVGTEHLLLALVRDSAGLPARLLEREGFSPGMAKARILWILTADPLTPDAFVAPTA